MTNHPEIPFSAGQIALDDFERLRQANLSRWPTGGAVVFEEAVQRQKSLPEHKRLSAIMRRAVSERRCLTQPRGGFGTFKAHRDLLVSLQNDGLADILPTTTDSYTRNERWQEASAGIEASEKAGRSMLNGFPIVNFGVERCSELIDAIDRPAIVLSGTAMPRLTSEIALASGFSGYLGSAIAYTVSYTKEVTIEEGITNYQYLDRLTALYAAHGVELHRRQPGFLTGTTVPPCIAIATCVLDALLAAHQGVRHYGLELGQTLNLIQDAASIDACQELCQHYLNAAGFRDVFTPMISLHWMGAWPQDEAQAAALVAYGGTLAAVSGASVVVTKTTHEAIGIPTPQANADSLKMTRMAIYLAMSCNLHGLPRYQSERALIRREVISIVDKTLEMGDGDVARGVVRAFAAGVLDIPWSPNRHVQSRVVPARDPDGFIRIVDPANMPFPKEVMELHEECLRKQAARTGEEFGPALSVRSVFEMSEALTSLMPNYRAA
jgi:methylaspartate mutase epsilon subunit